MSVLPVALLRPLPAPQQHRHFLLATDAGRKLTHAGAASATARANEPEQRRWLGHAIERMRAALLGNEEAGDLALHPRGDQNRARLSQRLHPGHDVGDIALNLAGRIHHCRAGFEPI